MMPTALSTSKRTNTRGYVLGLLTVVYAFNFVDRQILGILAPSIAADLGFEDTGIGLLTGFWFAVFYTGLGLPIAMMADRRNRRTIIAIALTLWSGFTFLSGFVTSFFWLALARVGVAIGEAGGSPPSHSLVSDLYSPEERGRALGIYSLGIPFGVMVAYLTAALLSTADQTNWRLVFFVLGAPGIILALVMFFTVKEPVRGRLDHAQAAATASLSDAIRQLLRFPAYWTMALGNAFASYAAYSFSSFLLRFISEAHPDASFVHVLIVLGVLSGTLYAAGTYAGGAVADRWARRTAAGYGWTAMVSIGIAAPMLLAAIWSGNLVAFYVFFGMNVFFGGFFLGPSFSVAQNLAPPKVRALSAAILLFVSNLIALGAGPTLTGALSDVLGLGKEIWYVPFSAGISDAVGGPMGSDLGRRWAMSTLAVAYMVSGIFFFAAARRLPTDMAKAKGETSPSSYDNAIPVSAALQTRTDDR